MSASILTPRERADAASIDRGTEHLQHENPIHYDRDGKPISLGTWAMLFQHHQDYRMVRHTEVGSVHISTVWLGIDMNFNFTGPPLIFETMVFGGNLGEEQWRYPTEVDAIRGHKRIVELVSMDHQI